jgi:DNA-binding NarL/FixJ family response regulator
MRPRHCPGWGSTCTTAGASPVSAGNPGGRQRAIEKLTPREREVIRALADGLSVREIAGRFHTGMVRNHIVSIFGKLGVHSRLQALVFAVRHGVVEIG